MAKDKNVVELLGEILASLSELVKKWSIWDLDLKKMLHVFHQLRKDDLVGLIEGTHKIERINYPKFEKKKPEYKVLIDLGIFTIPDDYVDKTCIHDFSRKYQSEVFVTEKISDKNARDSCGVTIKPGDKFHVYVYELVSEFMHVSSDDIRLFLKENGFVLLEAKGIAFVYDQRSELIPKSDDYYYSFGESGYYPIWLNYQSKKFFISNSSIDGDLDKGTVFFAFHPIN